MNRYDWQPTTRTLCGWRLAGCEDTQPPAAPGEITSTGICQACARQAFAELETN